MAMENVGEESEFVIGINVVPLVDIVMIIIFIITLPVMTHAVMIDLPRATNEPPPPVTEQPVSIDVQYDGSVLWNGNVVSPSDLRAYIKDAAAKDPQPEVHVSVDRRAKYDYAASVLFAVQRGGLKKIGFVADASGNL